MNEKLSRFMENSVQTHIFVGILAFGSGLGLGYVLSKRFKKEVYFESHDDTAQLELNFDAKGLADELAEIQGYLDEIKNEETVIHETEANSDAEEFVADKLKEAMMSNQNEEFNEDVAVVTQNVFAEDDDDWDYEEELKHRSPSKPYVIHRDEFWNNEMNFRQVSLNYYAGDNIMADEDDTPIYNHETVTGPMMFGKGSGDQYVFHVRNEKRQAEYEILYNPGLYSEDVLGLEIEDNQRARDIKHDRNRKFKLD